MWDRNCWTDFCESNKVAPGHRLTEGRKTVCKEQREPGLFFFFFTGIERRQMILGRKMLISNSIRVLWLSCTSGSKALEASCVNFWVSPDVWWPVRFPALSSLLWHPVFAEDSLSVEMSLPWEQCLCWHTESCLIWALQSWKDSY